jgi:hypothetical protein
MGIPLDLLLKADALRLCLGRKRSTAIKTVALAQPAFMVTALFFAGGVDTVAQIVDFVS